MARPRRRPSDAELERRRVADRERFRQATEQLLSSEGWGRWVRVRAHAGTSRYSSRNQLLIALQCPDASFVAGFHAWKGLGHSVRKGEKGLRILAPMVFKDQRDERKPQTDESKEASRVLFRTVAVFDRSQVDPIPGREQLPLEPPMVPLTGDTHAHLLAPLADFAETLGYTMVSKPLSGPAGGWCDPKAMEIVENADLPANGRVRIRVHELAHAVGVGYVEYGRQRAEVIVDTVIFRPGCCVRGLGTGGSVGNECHRRARGGSLHIGRRGECSVIATPGGRHRSCER
jgi:hypothetical protein